MDRQELGPNDKSSSSNYFGCIGGFHPFLFCFQTQGLTKETRGNQRSPFAYEVGVTARVIKKAGRAQRERRSDSTASPPPARPPTHLRQTHTHFVKRGDSWRDRRLTEGKVKPKGYGSERGRETHPSGERVGGGGAAWGKVGGGAGWGSSSKDSSTSTKNIKVGHR